MATEPSSRVGFIGLGAMGMGMACSVLKNDIQIKGYDINENARQTFAEAGGETTISAAEAAKEVDVLLIAVVNAEQAEDVLFGAGAAAESLPPGSVVMLCSTVKPDFARKTADKLYKMGLEMLDAPISGGAAKADQGRLSVMASGHSAAFDKAAAVLDAIAENVYRLGDECGQGSTIKMVNQLLAGVHIAAAAEAMALGVKAGADPATVYEVICNSAGSSWMFQNRVPHMLAGDYTPLSAVEIFVKDLGIVLETGKENCFPLPLAATAHQLFLMAAAAGFGREDDAAVVKVFETLANIDVKVMKK